VCPPELEAQIGGDMNTVRTLVNTAYRFAQAAPTSSAPTSSAAPNLDPALPSEIKRAVAAGQKQRMEFLYSINPDCTSIGFATVRILDAPKHGAVTIENGTGFTNFPQNNLRYECNKRRSDGVVVSYEPESGYTGPDAINVDVIYASGISRKRHYAIDVK
jgi:hypothetical protein